MKQQLVFGERGASAILITASLLLLFGLAAIAIDIGATKDERGFDQHASDASSLGGALELGLTGNYQPAVTDALRLVDANLGQSISSAEWEACSDPTPLNASTTALALGLSPATQCVSFFGFELVRVKLPDQVVDAAFAPILGVDQLTTSAVAVARVNSFPGIGNPPPFVVPSGTGSGQLLCLRTSSSGPAMPPLWTGFGPNTPAGEGPDADPCDDSIYDPDDSFFGTLNPLTYFDPDTGDVVCRQNLIDLAIANGIDHGLTTFDPPFVVGVTNPTGGQVVEGDCNPIPVGGVNTMILDTGLTSPILRCGLLSTNGGTCGTSVPGPPSTSASATPRLKQGDFANSGVEFVGEEMDDMALWEFLDDPTGLNWPNACDNLYANRSTPSWDYFDKKDALLDCLGAWSSAVHDPLFSDDILRTPRFAWIPFLAESNLTTQPTACPSSAAPQCVHFNDFVPVYLQTLYSVFTGGQNRGACDPGGNQPRWGRHDAGQGADCGVGNDNVDRLAAIVLDCEMLPEDICVAGATGGPGGMPVPRIELLR